MQKLLYVVIFFIVVLNTALTPSAQSDSDAITLEGQTIFGIHVLEPNNYMYQITELGVKVVKVQVRLEDIIHQGWIDYTNLDRDIQAITTSGLLPLLSFATFPAWGNLENDPSRPPDDITYYGYWIATILHKYPHVWGVELTNESNLEREWLRPNPQDWVNLFAATYPQLKAVNPDLVIISGALAPTWHNPPLHWSDEMFHQQAALYGLSEYVDCIGVHINATHLRPNGHVLVGDGIDHYSWYLMDTLTITSVAYSNNVPLCVTEYGVANSEIVGGVPIGFEWAGVTDISSQSTWMEEGLEMMESTNVQLVVFWNLDFAPACNGCIDEKSIYSILYPDGSPTQTYLTIQRYLQQYQEQQ